MLSAQDEKNKEDKITAIFRNAIKSPSLPTEREDTENFIRMFSGTKVKITSKIANKLIFASLEISNYKVLNYIIENVDRTIFDNVTNDFLNGFLYMEMLKDLPDTKTMRGLINRFDINPNFPINSNGDTLFFLSLEKCPEVSKDLIEKGASINVFNENDPTKRTPLMFASGVGYAELVNVMILHGANVNAVDAEGFTALNMAIINKERTTNDYEKKEKYDEIIQALVKNKANLLLSDTISGRGFTPFMEATINSDVKTLQVLIDHVPAEQKDQMLNGKTSRINGGKTPLMVAINMRQLETAKFLINQEGIDVRVLADNDQDTALTELISSICTTPQTVENKKYTDVAMNLLHNIVTLLGPISKHQKSRLLKFAQNSKGSTELVTILKESIIVREKQKKFKTQSSPGASALDDSNGDDGLQPGIKFSNPKKILSFSEGFHAEQPDKSKQISMDDADIEIGMRSYYRETESPKRQIPANIAEAKNDLILMKQGLDQSLTHDKTENFSSKIASRNKLVSKSFKHDTDDILTWKKELDENKKLKSILAREEQGEKAKSSFKSRVISSNSASGAIRK